MDPIIAQLPRIKQNITGDIFLIDQRSPEAFIYRTNRNTEELVVYIIKTKQPGYYVGYTRNLQKRLYQQSTIKGSCNFVKEHGGMDYLVYAEAARSKAKAIRRASELAKSLMKCGANISAGVA